MMPMSLLLAGLTIAAVVVLGASFLLAKRTQDAGTRITPLNDTQLPRSLRRRAEDRDAEYRRAGFEFLHSQRLTRRGIVQYSREYLHQDRTCSASDCVHKFFGFRMSGFQASVSSVMTDGTVIETSSHPRLPQFLQDLPQESRFRLTAAGTIQVRELMAEHRRVCETAIRETDHALIDLDAELLPHVSEYALQLMDWVLYQQGTLPKPPPPIAELGARQTDQ